MNYISRILRSSKKKGGAYSLQERYRLSLFSNSMNQTAASGAEGGKRETA
ncbi:hypothetical protein [Clostridium sp. HBUAS56010]|nr:hypothetical protein [Clostridium sp. HBUAS56010]